MNSISGLKSIIAVFIVFSLLASCGQESAKEQALLEREMQLEQREMELNEEVMNNSFKAEKTEEQLKQELAAKECNNPTKYLRITSQNLEGKFKNALSIKFDGFKVKMSIANDATITTFKNINCRVTLKSNSGGEILKKNFTIYEFVRARGQVAYKGEFDCSNQQFKDTDIYTIEIIGAECD